MSKRAWAAGAAVTVGVLGLAWGATLRPAAPPSGAVEPKSAPAKGGKKGAAKDFFGLTNVHQLHLHLSAKEWAKMQPAAARFPGAPFGPPGGAPKAKGKAAET